MSTYAMAVVVDTATREEAETILARVQGSRGFSPDRSVVHPPAEVGAWWRTSWYAGSTIFMDVGTKLFDAVTKGRAVVADDWDEYGAEWTCWQIADGAAAPVYRKYLSAAWTSQADVKPDIVGPEAAAAMAELWDSDPVAAVAVEGQFEAMSAGLGQVGTPFMPWFQALGLQWP